MLIGADLGGTWMKAVAVAADGVVVARRGAATVASQGRGAIMSRLVALVDAVREDARVDPRAPIGVAVPAVLDGKAGRIEMMPAFTPEWSGYALGPALAARWGVPVVLVNDVRAATIAEQRWGAGRPYRDFACLAIGTGIGGGLVLDGRLYAGSRGGAGELGHQTVEPDGPRCGCGNRGCLEAVASGAAIARQAAAAIAAGDTELARLAGSSTPDPAAVTLAAREGSATASRIYADAGRWIGLVLGNVVTALDPEAVIVGGGVSRAGELLLGPIREEIARRTVVFGPERGGVAVLPSPFPLDAGALGAAAAAERASGSTVEGAANAG